MPSANTKYYSLQGAVFLGKRQDDGSIGRTRWAFNVPNCELAIEASEETIKESHSGQRLDDATVDTGKTVTVSLSLHGFHVDNLAMALYATKYTRVASTVTGEELPAGLLVGEYFKLDRERISALVLTDSTGAPVTLTEDTHYRIESEFAGIGEILDLTGITVPIEAAYSYAETNSLALFSATPEEQYLVFDGINTQDSSKVYFELYRTKFKPAASLPLINNEGVGTLDLEGTALYDGTRAVDATLGGFGRMVLAGAT